MEDYGMTITYDGEKNKILCQGIIKDYPIGGLVCEYARLEPAELKEVLDSYPKRESVRNIENLVEAMDWLQNKLLERYPPVIALMCLTEFNSTIFELVNMAPEEITQKLHEANEVVEAKQVRQYILKNTGADKFCVDTIGGVFSYCYFAFALQYILFKGAFHILFCTEVDETNKTEFAQHQKKVEVILNFYGIDAIKVQQIGFRIINIEGELVSSYTIQSSLSLLLFETAHMIEKEAKIVKCKNCGHYFVVKGRTNSLYCDYPSPQNPNKTCKEIGAQIAMAEKMKNDEATHLYRTLYMRYKMLQKRHPNDATYPEVLKRLVNEAKEWRKKIKNNPDKRNEYIDWIKAFDKREFTKRKRK